ncbi:MAG: PAS domain S-box protein, partial [Gemmatimonadaceae bacterium]|nr:PAS domain S-box protein [Chitinophagaceae bacterium]
MPEFLQGGGEMGQRIREFNWSKTSLGPVETWPHSLRTCIRIMLDSRQPIWIGWGKDLIKFYNDPYKTIVGGKHPWALGRPASEVWKDIWTDIEPMLHQVMHDGRGTYVESQLLIMERYGYPEETYYTFSYTPIPDDEGKTAGMFCANTEDTDRITSERQLRTLTQLGKTLTDSKTGAEIIEKTISTLQGNPHDFPFALFRQIHHHKAILKGHTDFGDSRKLLPDEIDLESDNPLAAAIKTALGTGLPHMFETLKTHVGALPAGAWHVSPDKAIVLPIVLTGKQDAYGVMVVGINPFRPADEKYISFFSLVADLIATSFADVFAYEEERKRAEALAEIDKAKTAFFTNISHEFRTPLTLMLGSLEEIMEHKKKEEDQAVAIETTHRNALRLLRLVNNLLDFSRIEAGKVKASFSPTPISAFTAELASNFEQLIENAGLDFEIKIDQVTQPVYVDKEMWEKIVLNLLSNAFKFTMQGSIAILLHADDTNLTMEVRDTGLGIPDEELPKMFQRFHRVHNVSGRTYEGTGIGLSLVSELIDLHGGDISVTSKLGKGSSFIVTIPVGKEHLPYSQIAEYDTTYSATHADVFIDEAENLFNNDQVDSKDSERTYNPALPFILIVDDNADMRRHLTTLLQSEYNIVTAKNGSEALSKIKAQPFSLILSDIMMPVMDGTELVKAVKNNEQTANTPIILLSARAGEEAKIEGYNTGADDYLVKPFSAKELKARVRSQINLATKRLTALKKIEESEAYFRRLADNAPVTIWITEENGYCSYLSKSWYETTGQEKEEALGFGWLQATHPEDIERTTAIFADANTRQTFFHALYRLRQKDGTYRWSIDRGMPRFDDTGKYLGIIGAVVDVHEQRMAELALEESQEMQRLAVESGVIGTWGCDLTTEIVEMSETTRDIFGFSTLLVTLTDVINGIADYDQEKTRKAIEAAIRHPKGTYQTEYDVVNGTDGIIRSVIANGKIFLDKDGVPVKFFGTCLDVTKQKRTNEYLEAEVKTRTAE